MIRTARSIAALLLCCLALSAAKAPVQQGVTSKQVAFRYSRPDTAVCVWEVSTDSSFSPLVGGTAGEGGQDSGLKGERWFLSGVVAPMAASTVHYWRQTCGSEVYTGQFTTLSSTTTEPMSSFYSLGGHPQANKARVDYGPTPALGSSVEVPCVPSCNVTGIGSTHDSFLFVRTTYLNEADVIATGDLHLVVNR